MPIRCECSDFVEFFLSFAMLRRCYRFDRTRARSFMRTSVCKSRAAVQCLFVYCYTENKNPHGNVNKTPIFTWSANQCGSFRLNTDENVNRLQLYTFNIRLSWFAHFFIFLLQSLSRLRRCRWIWLSLTSTWDKMRPEIDTLCTRLLLFASQSNRTRLPGKWIKFTAFSSTCT